MVGWLIADRESGLFAEKLLADTIVKQHVDRDQLTIHADDGWSMAGKPVAFLLADLGVIKTHSRPHISNDNPLQRGPLPHAEVPARLPGQFGRLADAWYNRQHRHSSIAWHLLQSVHYGHAEAAREARADVFADADKRNPERFVRKHPEPARPTRRSGSTSPTRT